MKYDVFIKDLNDKDYCLILRNEQNEIVGFSTQKIINVPVNEKIITGVYSGDTIIHKEYWGSTELFKVFAQFFFEYAKPFDEFYWFLISKGYKTYKILSTFFLNFYPRYAQTTPPYQKSIMDAYAGHLFNEDYNPVSGVVEYKQIKDILKPGVADIDEAALKNKHVSFFQEANPGHLSGDDLICLALMDRKNIKESARKILGI
jgi:hypothetical protein